MEFVQIGIPARKVVDLAMGMNGAPDRAPLHDRIDRALARRSGEEPTAHMLTVEGTTGAMGMEKDGAKLASRPVKFMEEVSQPSRAASPPVLRLVISRRNVDRATPTRLPIAARSTFLVLIVDNGRGHSNVTSA